MVEQKRTSREACHHDSCRIERRSQQPTTAESPVVSCQDVVEAAVGCAGALADE